jgi:hypothetical protein
MVRRFGSIVVFLLAVVLAARGAYATPLAGPPAAGNWLLTNVTPTGETVLCIVKTEIAEGKPTAAVVFSRSNMDYSVKDFKATASEVSFTLVLSRAVQGRTLTTEQSFVGKVAGDGKQILGSLGDDRFALRAKLTATDKDKLENNELVNRAGPVEPFQKVNQLSARVAAVSRQYQQETDPEKKKELQEEVAAARRALEEQMPALYRETIEKHADSLAAAEAALQLLRQSNRLQITPEEAARFVKVIERHASPYGTRLWRNNMVQVAELLSNQQGMEAIALSAIEPVAKGLTDSDKANLQVRILGAYETALEKAGRGGEAKVVAQRLAKLDAILDQEYLATVPPFKPAPFAGRQDSKANRVAVLELFTGAQCPPCVAADVAFDALAKAYKPSDLVLIQYHMHIPGPDPMTNPDCIARWNYYRETFQDEVRGTPSTLFNGKPQAGGGGGMANAEYKYDQYRKIIDPLLEATSPITLTGKAALKDGQVDIAVEVAGAQPESEDLRLRMILVEDTVKYVGGNGLRFHHHVVRSMPGGPAGVVINDKNFRHVATASLPEIKAGLMKYLESYPKEPGGREFPYKARPLNLANLKAIVLVQNDKTKEILQAAMFDVEGMRAAAGK